ncbi:rRNA methyltransferase 3B [Schistosoma japonicum]|uniref:rRNA methyltransferase 3B n=1 Tax=Schistosoma japonicum TaxID=6182 RepID=A0A4Z2DXR6_SCHJA|nr:rRNA methyltransferase 3B [Schistosoma japonicum]
MSNINFYPELDENDPKIKEVMFRSQASLSDSGSKNQKSCRYPTIILEGSKLISDALSTGGKATSLFFSSPKVLQQVGDLSNVLNVYYVKHRIMSQLSSLKSPPGVIAVFELPQPNHFQGKSTKYHLPVTLILDRINDPGNVGSLIRSAASFGLNSILVTKGSVNIWNDKVLRAGMSGHFRIPIHQGLSWIDISHYFGICEGSPSPVTVHAADPEPPITDKLIDAAWKGDHMNHQSQDMSECNTSVECEAVNFLTPDSTNSSYLLPVQTVPHFAINYVPPDYDYEKNDCHLAIILGSEVHGVSPEAFHLVHLTGGSRLVIPSADGNKQLKCIISCFRSTRGNTTSIFMFLKAFILYEYTTFFTHDFSLLYLFLNFECLLYHLI